MIIVLKVRGAMHKESVLALHLLAMIVFLTLIISNLNHTLTTVHADNNNKDLNNQSLIRTIQSPTYSNNGIIHGAMTDEFGREDGNADLVNKFNNLAGKKIGVAYLSDNWFNGIHFPIDKCISIRSTGAIPFMRIQNWIREGDQLSDAGPYTHKNITAGMFDDQLRAYAKAAKRFGTTLLIEYGVEINGNWFP